MDLSQLTSEQRQAVLMQAQQEANQRIMSDVSDSILRFYLSHYWLESMMSFTIFVFR
jgi:hypothetical protein